MRILVSLFFLSLFVVQGSATAVADSVRLKSYADSAMYYLDKQDFKKSCDIYRIVIKLQDTVTTQNYKNEIKQLRSESQIDELYLENVRQQNEILAIILIFCGILGVLAVAMLLYLRTKNKLLDKSRIEMEAAKQKAEHSLERQNIALKAFGEEIEPAIKSMESASRQEDVAKTISMIKSKLLVLLLFLLPLSVAAASNFQRDSVVNLLSGMPADKAKLEKIHALVQQYQTADFALELAEMLIQESQKQEDDSMLLAGLSVAFRISLSAENTEKSGALLSQIKETSLRYDKSLDNYYRMWGALMQVLASQGNIEKVKDEAKKLRKEAEQGNNLVGKVSADLALSNAYYFQKDNATAAEILEKTLEEESLSTADRLRIYERIFTYYQNLRRYDDALGMLDKSYKLMGDKPKPADMLRYHTRYAIISSIQKKYDKTLHHLQQAKTYYTEDCSVASFMLYHDAWARYYDHTKAWDLCVNEYEQSIKRIATSQPMLKLSLQRSKVLALKKAGRWEDAAKEYHAIYTFSDSLYRGFLNKQAKAIAENYRWELGLLENARNEKIIKIVVISFVLLFLLLLTVLLYRILKINKKLRKQEQAIVAAANVALQADKFRELLVRNTKAGLSGAIAEIEALLRADRLESLPEIKHIARRMYLLAADVKELTYMESGQIEYNCGEYDILSFFCTVLEVERENPIVEFSADIGKVIVRADRERFNAFLASAFMLPANHKLEEKVTVSIFFGQTEKEIVIEFFGTFLAKENVLDGEFILRNEINRQFIESFGGSYLLKRSVLRPELVVTFPMAR